MRTDNKFGYMHVTRIFLCVSYIQYYVTGKKSCWKSHCWRNLTQKYDYNQCEFDLCVCNASVPYRPKLAFISRSDYMSMYYYSLSSDIKSRSCPSVPDIAHCTDKRCLNAVFEFWDSYVPWLSPYSYCMCALMLLIVTL